MVQEPAPRGLGVPVITLLLEVTFKFIEVKYISDMQGGTDALNVVKESLASHQPCIVIEVSF